VGQDGHDRVALDDVGSEAASTPAAHPYDAHASACCARSVQAASVPILTSSKRAAILHTTSHAATAAAHTTRLLSVVRTLLSECEKSDLPDAAVVKCVVDGFRKLQFPKPEGGIVTVVYPIVFNPED
jgi:hypothetical protein